MPETHIPGLAQQPPSCQQYFGMFPHLKAVMVGRRHRGFSSAGPLVAMPACPSAAPVPPYFPWLYSILEG